MPPRHDSLETLRGPTPTDIPFAAALRRTFAAGYGLAALRADLLAGTVVGVVALPLSMALAIAVGVPPQHGLYTAIVAGAVVALTGGSKFQVTGPTAAFVVILAPIVGRYGLAGLLTAGLMAGLLLIGMGVARLGRFIQFIPHPVTTGFTAGIATVIATLQLKDVFGLAVERMPKSFGGKVLALWGARGTASATEVGVAVTTIALLVLTPRIVRRLPAPLVAIGGIAALAAALHHVVPGFSVATIGARFHSHVGGRLVDGIPPLPPVPGLPWSGTGLSLGLIRKLLPSAFVIAMLGAIESLAPAPARRSPPSRMRGSCWRRSSCWRRWSPTCRWRRSRGCCWSSPGTCRRSATSDTSCEWRRRATWRCC